MKKSSRILALITALVMIVAISATPYRAYAFSEDAINLDIDTTTIEVANAWAQIKNAALIHLIAQKMQMCVKIGQVILNADDTGGILGGTVWPAYTKTEFFVLTYPGVLDTGNVFKGDAWVSLDWNQNIGVGTWMSSIYGENDGTITCNQTTGKGNLFDMFVYIYKNYKAGIDADDLQNASVTEADRLKIVCNKDDPTKAGLLQPSNSYGTPSNTACNSSSVEWYTGVSIDDQLAYIKSVYEEMRANFGNKYIVAWDDLGYYGGVDGYYLYSNDFEKQCGSASFSTRQYNEDGYVYKQGYEIKSNGTVREGYYEIKASSDTARQSFVDKVLTCQDLVDEMNEHIKEYIQFVNHEIYNVCKTGVDEAIDDKRREINEKYIENENSTEAELEDANAVLDEYTRIQNDREYVAMPSSDRSFGGGGRPGGSFGGGRTTGGSFSSGDQSSGTTVTTTTTTESETLIKVSNTSESAMPTDYIWTCRSHLPYIDVVVQEEADLSQAIEDEFTDYCYTTLDLAWVVCPIIRWVSDAVDNLSEEIEGFF